MSNAETRRSRRRQRRLRRLLRRLLRLLSRRARATQQSAHARREAGRLLRARRGAGRAASAPAALEGRPRAALPTGGNALAALIGDLPMAATIPGRGTSAAAHLDRQTAAPPGPAPLDPALVEATLFRRTVVLPSATPGITPLGRVHSVVGDTALVLDRRGNRQQIPLAELRLPDGRSAAALLDDAVATGPPAAPGPAASTMLAALLSPLLGTPVSVDPAAAPATKDAAPERGDPVPSPPPALPGMAGGGGGGRPADTTHPALREPAEAAPLTLTGLSPATLQATVRGAADEPPQRLPLSRLRGADGRPLSAMAQLLGEALVGAQVSVVGSTPRAWDEAAFAVPAVIAAPPRFDDSGARLAVRVGATLFDVGVAQVSLRSEGIAPPPAGLQRPTNTGGRLLSASGRASAAPPPPVEAAPLPEHSAALTSPGRPFMAAAPVEPVALTTPVVAGAAPMVVTQARATPAAAAPSSAAPRGVISGRQRSVARPELPPAGPTSPLPPAAPATSADGRGDGAPAPGGASPTRARYNLGL